MYTPPSKQRGNGGSGGVPLGQQQQQQQTDEDDASQAQDRDMPSSSPPSPPSIARRPLPPRSNAISVPPIEQRPATPQLFSPQRKRFMSFSHALTPSAFAAALQPSTEEGVMDADPVSQPPQHHRDQRRLSNIALQSRQSREHIHPSMYYGSHWSQPQHPTRSLAELSKNGVVWIDGKRHHAPDGVWHKFKPDKRSGMCCMPDDDGKMGSRACMCRVISCGVVAFLLLILLLTGVLILACYMWQARLPITSITLLSNTTAVPVAFTATNITIMGTLRLSIENLNAWPADISVQAHYQSIGVSQVKQLHLPPKGGMVDVYLPVQLVYTPSSDPGWMYLRQMLSVCKRLESNSDTYMRWRITLTMRLFKRAIRFSTSKLRLVPSACLVSERADSVMLGSILPQVRRS